MGVKLEVFRGLKMLQGSNGRMTLYLTFPVAMFWIANQAEWFEDYVIQRKRELWPPEREDQRRELEEFKEKIRKQREEKLLRAAQQSS
ncbi:protein PET100 homolog, mitochondrial isoform X2 [Enhydra lutris kenyoni]|uniref:Protein PET100 homolog, mitochondrial isoform X2 n=2 Tax=Lutrinae TaxID=169417 RepID=A0A2Y9L5V7_ENHLU|nr:protein PET100 homolog, mitochondrial isoform X2 [Enhydra lutris kenyoni]